MYRVHHSLTWCSAGWRSLLRCCKTSLHLAKQDYASSAEVHVHFSGIITRVLLVKYQPTNTILMRNNIKPQSKNSLLFRTEIGEVFVLCLVLLTKEIKRDKERKDKKEVFFFIEEAVCLFTVNHSTGKKAN